VIVEENWRESRYFVDSLDWRKQLEDLANVKPAPQEKLARKRETAGPSTLRSGRDDKLV
jgi:hypothetical protein